jgi:hypothetical protein
MRLCVFAGLVGVVAVCTAVYGGPPVEPGVPFVENKRQWPSPFLYGAEFKDTRVYLDATRLFFVQFTQRSDGQKGQPELNTAFSEVDHVHRGYTALGTYEVKFFGAQNPVVAGIGEQPTLYNYFIGNDSTKWTSGAQAFDGVQYKGLYEGIDLVVYSQDGFLKSDWVVAPCGDPSQISLEYNGVEDVDLRDGRLFVRTRLGDVTEDRPVAYQYVNGVKRLVSCEYVLIDRVVTFRFPDGYDTNYELVIDPILIFSSYSGSTSDNWGNTATPDRYGNLYSGGMVTGALNSTGFPATAGAYQTKHQGGGWDVGILKYDSVGWNLLYVTYLGGTGVETPQSLVVNNQDELLILGATSSSDFPGTTNAFKGGSFVDPIGGVSYVSGTDIFIAKLSPNGAQLVNSRLLGGSLNDAVNYYSSSTPSQHALSKNYGDQLRGDITVDSEDNVFIASNTQSSNFPVVNGDANATFHGGSHDAVIVKLNSNLSSVIWSRLIGGSQADAAYSVKITKQGRLYVAGGTSSTDLAGMNGYIKTAPGNINGWILELSTDGSTILNGTYLGTASYDQIYFIDIGTQGDVFAYGQTSGLYPNLPNTLPFRQPGGGQFLHKLSSNLSTSIFSMTFGSGRGGPDISPTAFLVNDCNNIYMAGWGGEINSTARSPYYLGGNTSNLPVTPDAHQSTTFAGNDFYMMVLTGTVELVYATYLGGTTSPTHVDGGTSRFDKKGIVYHAVCAGCRGNSDFPTKNVPPSRSHNGSPNCNNAAFKFDLSSLKAKIQTNNVQLTTAGLASVCMPDPIVFENKSIGGEVFRWDLGDGTKVQRTEHDTIRHYYRQPGTYIVKLTSIDVSTCVGIDSTFAVVYVTLSNMSAAEDRTICSGSSTRLDASGAAFYEWKGERTPFTSREKSPLVAPDATERYFVTMTDGGGCKRRDTIDVTVIPGMDLQFEVETVYDCTTRPQVIVKSHTEPDEGEEIYFAFGDGTSAPGPEEVHNYQEDGLYRVTLVGTKQNCVYEATSEVPVVTVQVPNVITPADSPGLNDAFKVLVGNPGALRDAVTISLGVYNRWGEEIFRDPDYKDDWSASNVEEGVYYYEVDITGHTQCKGWVHVIK